jgi:tetratricopeptide (TPR) repeat protein
MKNRMLSALSFVLLFALGVAGQTPGPPTLEPVASTESQKLLIKEGVTLHDKSDYEGAIARYEQVLKENPDNVLALYEMSFSYYASKNYQKSIAIAYKAAQYKSNLLDAIYVQIGSAFDDMGESSKAIDAYKAGLQLNPSNSLLLYNLSVTYARMERFDDARATAKQAAILEPNHPGTQRLLSFVFSRSGYKIPALLAGSRFLILEPASKRSDGTLQLIEKIMQSGVTPPKDGNNIKVQVDGSPQKKDEGDFSSLEMTMGLIVAGNYMEKGKGKTEMQLLVGNFNSLFAILSELSVKDDQSKLAWNYYAPYFIEMKKLGHTEAFVYFINQQSNKAGVIDWLKQNQAQVTDFLNWSKGYKWPGGRLNSATF